MDFFQSAQVSVLFLRSSQAVWLGTQASHVVDLHLGDPPYISPDGYNSSLYGSEVELRCLLPNDTSIFLWLINGENSLTIGQITLAERGIRYDSSFSLDGDQKYSAIFIEPRAENNDTVLQCRAYTDSPPFLQESSEIIFRVQGEKFLF